MLLAGREEMLRLGLKPEVHHDDDGTVRIVLYVNKWLWLVPLIASFGTMSGSRSQLTCAPPCVSITPMRSGLRRSRQRRYDGRAPADYRNDDSRLRSTRGRNPRSVRE